MHNAYSISVRICIVHCEWRVRKGKSMEELILYIVKRLVNEPDAVKVERGEDKEGIEVYNLTVSDDDKGFIIGKQGRVAKAIRQIVRSVAAKNGKKINIDIL